MRTFDEIQADVRHASDISDADSLIVLAAELAALDTPTAMAAADRARGLASYYRSDYPTALEHYQCALAIYQELGDRSSQASLIANIGIVHMSTGDYPLALDHYHRALAVQIELDDRSSQANVLGNIGIVCYHTSDYPAALEYHHRALALREQLGNRGSVARAHNNIGNVYNNTGDYPTALEHFYKALALHVELDDLGGQAMVIGNIGIALQDLGDYPAALEHFLRALTLNQGLGRRSGVANVTGNIGILHGWTGDYPTALAYLHNALTIFQELGERKDVANMYGNIMATYLNMGSNDEARAILTIWDAMQIDDPKMQIHGELQRATLQERSGEIDGAVATLKHALDQAHKHGLRPNAAEIQKALRDLALKRNDLPAYVEHNNEFTRITEEINGKETTLKVAMQAKQREIDAERKEYDKHMAVLHSTLPKHIADRVARGETVNDHFDNATVLFLDVVGFTTHSNSLDATAVVDLLQEVFTSFDAICAEHDVMKIKTIGDSYMAAAFPIESSNSEQRAANVARAMIASSFTWPKGDRVQFRIGLHSGPVVAGVLGTERMQYDVWGDTVNVASRMESTSEPGRIHVSEAFANALKTSPLDPLSSIRGGTHSPFPIPYSLRERGALEIKGKGTMTTYWLESKT